MNTLRLLCFALSAGMLLFAAVSIILTVEGKTPGSRTPGAAGSLGMTLLSVTVAVGIGAVASWHALRAILERGAREIWRQPLDVATKERTLWSRYGTLQIARIAFAESFGLLGIISLFLAAQWWGLLAPAIAIGVILAGLPSQGNYEQFLSRATSER